MHPELNHGVSSQRSDRSREAMATASPSTPSLTASIGMCVRRAAGRCSGRRSGTGVAAAGGLLGAGRHHLRSSISQLILHRGNQVIPALHERCGALTFEHIRHVGEIDADCRELNLATLPSRHSTSSCSNFLPAGFKQLENSHSAWMRSKEDVITSRCFVAAPARIDRAKAPHRP